MQDVFTIYIGVMQVSRWWGDVVGPSICLLEALQLHLPLEEVFAAYEWEAWPEADLDRTMVYLRTSSKVAVPAAFKPLIPKSMDACAALYK